MSIDMGLGNGYLIYHVRRDTGEGHDYCVVKGKRLDRTDGKSLKEKCDKHGAKLSRLYGTTRTSDLIAADEAEAHETMEETYDVEHHEP